MNKLRKPPSGFTMVPNTLIRCEGLSLKAKGLYCLLFAKPDNWTYVEEVLIKESTDGRDAFRAGLKELIQHGWLTKLQVRDKNNQFSHTEWHLSVDGKAVDGFSGDGKSDTNNTYRSKTDKIPPNPQGEETRFEEIWKARWGRADAPNPKKPALKSYLKAIKAGAAHEDILKAVKARHGVGKPDTEYAPQLVTWLNQERWKDAGGGETGKLSPEEIKAAEKRAEEAKRKHDEMMAKLVEDRRRQLGMTT